ncbi:MAG: nodulation protein NfeD [Alteromonadaceae bacterium]|nr:nodulation protein NfeD [Alteromonadaceae bacterium]
MRLNRLDLNLLVALDALLTERSITLAAERICLSQPATSGALARLREFFNDDLLVRVGAKMQPTPLGESLAEPVHNILLQIQATVERGIEFDPFTCNRKFKFLAGDYSSTVLLTAVAKHINTLAPEIQFEFFIPTNKPGEMLDRAEVDFMIMPTSVKVDHHPSVELFSEKFVSIACAQNDAVHSNMTMDEFLNLGHVTVKFGTSRVTSQDQVLMKDQWRVEPNVEIITSTFNAIPQFLPGTGRIATVYQHLAEHWQKLIPIKIVPLPKPLPEIAWALQWHKYRDHDPALVWLREQIITTARQTFG